MRISPLEEVIALKIILLWEYGIEGGGGGGGESDSHVKEVTMLVANLSVAQRYHYSQIKAIS